MDLKLGRFWEVRGHLACMEEVDDSEEWGQVVHVLEHCVLSSSLPVVASLCFLPIQKWSCCSACSIFLVRACLGWIACYELWPLLNNAVTAITQQPRHTFVVRGWNSRCPLRPLPLSRFYWAVWSLDLQALSICVVTTLTVCPELCYLIRGLILIIQLSSPQCKPGQS